MKKGSVMDILIKLKDFFLSLINNNKTPNSFTDPTDVVYDLETISTQSRQTSNSQIDTIFIRNNLSNS